MKTDKPNIVWVLCDQMRWDIRGYTGRSLVGTPVIDRLAADGIAFENAYCASPICSPARASWVTGLYPHGHRQYINYAPKWKGIPGCSMPDKTITVGDVLKGEGYKCGIAGVWHLGNDDQPQHGFTDYWIKYSYHDLSLPDPHFAYLDELGIINPYDPANRMIRMEGILPYAEITDHRQQRTSWVVDRSLEFLESRECDQDDPFFLMVGIKDPHPIMAPPPDLLKEYPPKEMPIPDNFRDPLVGKPESQHRGRRRITEANLSKNEMRVIMQHYYALVANVDREIGRIVDCLRSKGLTENTVLVFSSDHGEQLGNHGFVEKGYLYEESVKVPCIISWPSRLRPGVRIKTPLAGVDLMPTLLGLAHCPIPGNIDGRSVAEELIEGVEPEELPVYAEIGDGIVVGNSTDPEYFASHIMVLFQDWKYIQNRDEVDELYNLKQDPGEMRNLAFDPVHNDRISSMRKLIKEMVVKTGPDQYAWCLQ